MDYGRQKLTTLSRQQLLALGEAVGDRLTPMQLARWATAILTVAVGSRRPSPSIEKLLRISSQAQLWIECKDLFGSIRTETLQRERHRKASGLWYLAENVAKVLYNAAGANAKFDHDAATWLPVCTAAVCSEIEDSARQSQLDDIVFDALKGQTSNE